MGSVEELCDHIALIDRSRVILSGNVREIKKTYRTSTFSLSYNTFDGDLLPLLPDGFTILEETRDADHRHARIRIPATSSPNDLVRSLLPHVTLYGMQELIPDMNDIFIQVVTENSGKSSSNA
jgi:ABC-2 type transport system ATP-binding protein